MPEIGVVGQNSGAITWGWQIAVYLFLGGLVAGLMIFSGAMRFSQAGFFRRALFLADLTALPLLGVGMFFLLLDLANKTNVWRLYTAFQALSVMSWGAWILLATMLFLALRFITLVPAPKPASFLGIQLFAIQPESEEAEEDKPARKPSAAESAIQWVWSKLELIAQWVNCRQRAFSVIGILLGTAVGFYTGILLSTIPARPLWNTAVLAPLFLVSGLASGGAFLCLFLPAEEHKRLVPFSILFCGIELLLLLAFVLNLQFGNEAVQRAGSLVFNGLLGWAFWGLVILLGLLLPAVFEQLELMHVRLPLVPKRVPPVLKLVGSLALRFVIVYAGMLSFV